MAARNNSPAFCLEGLENYEYVYIMYFSNKPMGCIAFTEVKNDTLEIGQVYAGGEYRNQGVVTKLFEKVLKTAKQKGQLFNLGYI